jgi:2'-phosphotransferase
MTPAGWVPVQEILESKNPRLKGSTLQAIEEVVATSDKKRFAFAMRPRSEFSGSVDNSSKNREEEEEQIMCIRASQGHSIKMIDPDLLLTKLSPEELAKIPCIVHGTNMDAWKSIAEQGLSKMARTHIHLATGLPQDNGVISGMRRTATVYVYVDSEACTRDGIEFYISDNGVVLTDGIGGCLPVEYFLRVTDSNGGILMAKQNGDKV